MVDSWKMNERRRASYIQTCTTLKFLISNFLTIFLITQLMVRDGPPLKVHTLMLPTDHFGTEHYGKSHIGMDVSWQEHFDICIVRCCGRSGRWTFQNGDFLIPRTLSTWNYQHTQILAEGYFGIVDVPWHSVTRTFFGMEIFQHLEFRLLGTQNSLAPTFSPPDQGNRTSWKLLFSLLNKLEVGSPRLVVPYLYLGIA